MDDHQTRSRSAPESNKSRSLSHSPSPVQCHQNIGSNTGFESAITQTTFTTGPFNNAGHSPQFTSQSPGVSPGFIHSSQVQQYPSTQSTDPSFLDTQNFNQALTQEDLFSNFPDPAQFNGNSNEGFSQFLNTDQPDFNDMNMYPNHSTSIEGNFEQSLYDSQQHQSINPVDIMSRMSSPPSVSSPPNLVPQHHSSPGSQQGSPVPVQNQFYTPGHSRHTSLDPSSAAFPQTQTNWSTGAFTHHRTPSEISDVSSSAAPSPYMQQEAFDSSDFNRSPLLNSQDQLYPDALGMEEFSLGEGPGPQISPGHSPYMAPQPQSMAPQGLGLMSEPTLPLSQNMSTQFGAQPGLYTHQSDSMVPSFHRSSPATDMGQADQMAPPEINVEFAPPSRQSSFDPNKNQQGVSVDSLNIPERGRRGRTRAVSDPFSATISRSSTPATTSPHLGPSNTTSFRGLSPGSNTSSRDVSPASLKSNRRSSTSSMPANRDYILDLADPSRPGASIQEKGRVQKHPATFQCHLCPKRFTRAYNLRSHLRTHTDERPFVCTICGKAFARQHDRKRHEGLHSGEKKFVCRGDLSSGGQWGCGRRFARADALGRHFRSEAGRICIKPLLDEEALERRRVWEQEMLNASAQQQAALIASQQQQQQQQQIPSQPIGIPAAPSFTLPVALLNQYPALRGLQWDALPSNDDPSDISGRSSFDAGSTTGDVDFDDGGYVSGPGAPPGMGLSSSWGGGDSGWSDFSGRGR
ncbi:MAG: DNA-binding transcription factor [Cirrosporium novae-zelandiae]|nr:MAG: DNA-binding transcription factor [Cirrosporium novae-zelandiae]